MPYLADTNVDSRFTLPNDPLYARVRKAVLDLQKQGEVVYVTAQVLIEFQALATRPGEANGLGLSRAQASAEASKIEAVFPLLPEVPAIYPLWRNLIDAHDVIGRQVYDARLVAVMLAHGVDHILTLNGTHFQRFTGITVVSP